MDKKYKKIGLSYFQNNELILRHQIKNILENVDFTLKHDWINQQEFQKLIENMRINESLIIRIRNLSIPQKNIAKVEFSKLILLGISDCNIVSLQWLCFSQLPCVTRLDLNFNKIVSLKGIMKTNDFKKLDALNLEQNYLKDISHLSRYNFQEDIYLKLQLDQQKILQKSIHDESFCDNICHIIKLNVQNFVQLVFLCKKRISQNKYFSQLKKKHVQYLEIRGRGIL